MSGKAMIETIDVKGPTFGNGQICREILSDLPEWFGISEANDNYAEKAETLPTFTAEENGRTIGFLTLLLHSQESAEIYVFGVRKSYHRRGIGKRILEATEEYLRSEGFKFVQVKTLAALAADANYEKTRAFYEGQGYVTLEVFPDMWDAENPCLQMIKGI